MECQSTKRLLQNDRIIIKVPKVRQRKLKIENVKCKIENYLESHVEAHGRVTFKLKVEN